jgi:hypothetical protein
VAERVRVEIGFDGGQVMLATIGQESVAKLEGELGSGDGTIALEAEDGVYTVSLRKILYVKRFARESRVGFGH